MVDRALDLPGGFGMFRRVRARAALPRRAGRIHPVSSNLAHEFLAKLTLGINPDEQPRWG